MPRPTLPESARRVSFNCRLSPVTREVMNTLIAQRPTDNEAELIDDTFRLHYPKEWAEAQKTVDARIARETKRHAAG